MRSENVNLADEKKQFKKFAILSVVFSVLAHSVFLISHVGWSSENPIAVEEKKIKKVKLVFKSKSKNPHQIVNTELEREKETPKKAKYLGKQNQIVEKETKAAVNGSFKSAGFGERDGIEKAQVAVQKSSKGKVKKKTKDPSKKKIVKSKKSKKIKFEDLSFGNLALSQPTVQNAPSLGTKKGSHKLKGLASNNDFMDDIPLADMTRLNTIEYKYYGFYFRIRQKLEQYWGDSLREQAEKMWKSGRRLASDVNKVTALKITIDQQGNILEVKVKSTSGINELDNAAIESFNRAGPFPNPPSGLIKNGRAQIEWGFVVKS